MHVVRPERRRCGPLFVLAARLSPRSVVKRALEPDVPFRGGVASGEELVKAVGVTQRVIAYYERDDAQPPGAVLVHLAQALR